MSVAGIFASGLFSDAMSQLGQKSPSAAKQPASGSSFTALQQELASQSSPLTLADSVAAQFPQFGVRLATPSRAAQPPSSNSPSSQTGAAGREATVSTSPLSVAWQAYNSLQQNPVNTALGNALQANSAGISINI